MTDILWDRIKLREFKSLASLTPDEEAVLKHWSKGDSIVYTAMSLNMSPRTVDSIKARLRQKYDEVEAFTPLLPAR